MQLFWMQTFILDCLIISDSSDCLQVAGEMGVSDEGGYPLSK
jgi:hypothetical protein